MSDIKFKKIQYGPELEFEYSTAYRKLKDLPNGIVKANPAENSGEVIDINFGGFTAPGMATPVDPTDGANKSYVDGITYDVVRAGGVLTTDYLLLGSNNDEYLLSSTHLHVTNSGTNLNAGSFNNVILTTGGSATLFLNAAGHYTTPIGGGNVTTSVTLALNYLVVGNNTSDVKITPHIYTDATGSNLYVGAINDITLTTGGSPTAYLNAAGAYTVPSGSGTGNVSTAVTLTNQYMIIGAGTDNVKTAVSIYADATGAKLYVGAINDIVLTTGGSATAYLNAAGGYSVPSGSGTGNVNTSVTLTDKYMLIGGSGTDVDVATSIYTDATGSNLYVGAINGVVLTATGSPTSYLNAAGAYTVPSGSGTGNVNTSATLTDKYMLIGSSGTDVEVAAFIYVDATGAKLYVGAINDITLTTGGSPTAYLNAAGGYSVPSGSGTGNVNTSVTLTDKYMLIGSSGTDVEVAASIYTDATGSNLYVGAINGVALTATGSPTQFLNAAGQYATPAGAGNVNTSVTLTDKHMLIGSSGTDVDVAASIYTDATGAKLYVGAINDITLTTGGSPALYLNAAGHYTTPIGGGNVDTSVTLALNYLVVGNNSHNVKVTPSIYVDATGSNLYAARINDVALDSTGTDEYFLTQSGSYVVFPGVSAANELTAQTLLVGAGGKNCKAESGVTTSYIERGSITSIEFATAPTVKVFSTNVGTLTSGQTIILYNMTDPHYNGEFIVSINDEASFFILTTFTTTATGSWTDLLTIKNLEVFMFNGVPLTNEGSSDEYLTAAGDYRVPPDTGNVNADSDLGINELLIGADGSDCLTAPGLKVTYPHGVHISSITVHSATELNVNTTSVSGLNQGTIIRFIGMSNALYNGEHAVTSIHSATQFKIGAEYIGTSTGTWLLDLNTINLNLHSVNEVKLDATGSVNQFLNGTGLYSLPPAVDTSVSLTNEHVILGASGNDVKVASNIYANSASGKLYAHQFNDVSLTTGGSAAAYLNAAGAYTVPPIGGNVDTSVTLTSRYIVVGNGSANVKSTDIYVDANGEQIYAKSFNGVKLDASGDSNKYLNGIGGYTTPPGVIASSSLVLNHMVVGVSSAHVKTTASIYADSTGTKLYAPYVNDVVLTAGQNINAYLNQYGTYTPPKIEGLTTEARHKTAITSIANHSGNEITIHTTSTGYLIASGSVAFNGMSNIAYNNYYEVTTIVSSTQFRIVSAYHGSATGTWYSTVPQTKIAVTSISVHDTNIININTSSSIGAYPGGSIILRNMHVSGYNGSYKVANIHSSTQIQVIGSYISTSTGYWEPAIVDIDVLAESFNGVELIDDGSLGKYLNQFGTYTTPKVQGVTIENKLSRPITSISSHSGSEINVTTTSTEGLAATTSIVFEGMSNPYYDKSYLLSGVHSSTVFRVVSAYNGTATGTWVETTDAPFYHVSSITNHAAGLQNVNTTSVEGTYPGAIIMLTGVSHSAYDGTYEVESIHSATQFKIVCPNLGNTTGGKWELVVPNVNVIAAQFNGIELTHSGSDDAYLNATGDYTIPKGSGGDGNVTTSITLSANYVLFGNNEADVKIHTQIYTSSSGGVLYASGMHMTHCTSDVYIGNSFNGAALIDSGSSNAYLNATGQYSVPGPLEPGSIFIALKNCKYDHAVNLETDTGKTIENNEFIDVVPSWKDLGLPKLSEQLTYFMRS